MNEIYLLLGFYAAIGGVWTYFLNEASKAQTQTDPLPGWAVALLGFVLWPLTLAYVIYMALSPGHVAKMDALVAKEKARKAKEELEYARSVHRVREEMNRWVAEDPENRSFRVVEDKNGAQFYADTNSADEAKRVRDMLLKDDNVKINDQATFNDEAREKRAKELVDFLFSEETLDKVNQPPKRGWYETQDKKDLDDFWNGS